jgi:hypothetical protein
MQCCKAALQYNIRSLHVFRHLNTIWSEKPHCSGGFYRDTNEALVPEILINTSVLTLPQCIRKHRRPRPFRPPRRFHPHGQLLLRQHRHVAEESQDRRSLQRPIPFTRLVQPHAARPRQRPLEPPVFERWAHGLPWWPADL